MRRKRQPTHYIAICCVQPQKASTKNQKRKINWKNSSDNYCDRAGDRGSIVYRMQTKNKKNDMQE